MPGQRMGHILRSFQAIAGVLGLVGGLVGIGVWIGDWRADQVHREMTKSVLEVTNDLAIAEKTIANMQSEVQSLTKLLEIRKEDLVDARGRITDLEQKLKASDSRRIQEADTGKEHIAHLENQLTDAHTRVDDIRRMLNERMPLLSFNVVTNQDLSEADLYAENIGDEQVRVVYRGYNVWINGIKVDFNGWNRNALVMRPGESLSLTSYQDFPGRQSPVTNKVGDAACILYEPATRSLGISKMDLRAVVVLRAPAKGCVLQERYSSGRWANKRLLPARRRT